MGTNELALNHNKGSFWDSIVGKMIRWLAFVPFGIISSYLILGLSVFFCLWFFGSLRGFLIIGVLFGGVFFLYGFVLLYAKVIYLTIDMCPNPKIGKIIFGIIYYINYLGWCVHMLLAEGGEDFWDVKILSIFICVISMAVTGFILAEGFPSKHT